MVFSKDDPWDHVLAVTRPALALAPKTFLVDLQADLHQHGVIAAVEKHDTAAIFDWLLSLLQLQGISDRAAFAYSAKHGLPIWDEIDVAMCPQPSCPKLRSHWHFKACGYVKTKSACNEPDHLYHCPLPHHPWRKGGLGQAAYGLYLFIRDVCDGDFVAWIDRRLEGAVPCEGDDPTQASRRARLALIEPLSNVSNVGPKLWSMALADLLIVGKGSDPLWRGAGVAMIAIDSLVHNFLHRTGSLQRLGAHHPYGPASYATRGCIEVIEGLASRIDARRFNPDFPAYFPRFVQSAIWSFCAADRRNICNGNRIDDSDRCRNRYCPAFHECDRVAVNII